MKGTKFMVAVMAAAMVLAGCGNMNNTKKGAAIGTTGGAALGAGIGALVGKLTGNTKKGAIIGAAAGTAAGATAGTLIGRKMDKAKAAAAAVANAEAETVKDGNSPEAALMGCAPADNPDLVALISPITYVDNDIKGRKGGKIPRFLVFHGDADNVVPHCQGVNFSEVLRNAGLLEEFVSVPEGGHGPVTFNDKTFKQMTDFFLKEAKKK